MITEGELIIMGKAVDVTPMELYEASLPILLPGYRLLQNYSEPFRIMSLNRAQDLERQLPVGSVIKVILFGKDYIFERNDSHRIDVSRTIAVRMGNQELPETLLRLVTLNKRLHDEADIATIPAKRVRADEDNREAFMGFDDLGAEVELDYDV